MCNTGWKKVLERCGRTQRSTAQALNVNQAELSLVMQGRAFLTPEKFNKACELLGCRPTEVYGDDVLEVMYGRAKEQVRKRDRRVTIGEPQFSNVCKMADLNKCSKADIVNAILYAYLCKDEYYCVQNRNGRTSGSEKGNGGRGMNYEQLVNALRFCDNNAYCSQCPRYEDGEECYTKLHIDAAAAIEALQAEVKFYKNLAEEWQETADRKERLLGMNRAQNFYSAKDASGNFITNLCSLNRSESPNSPENPDS